MIRFWTRTAALVAGLALASMARAQDIPIRSGEHETFTRLVLTLPAPTEWELGSTGRRATLRLSGNVASFGTNGVFDRIPRSRLLALRASPADGTLQMDLACDCEVRGFVDRNRFLVIDIADSDQAALAAPSWRDLPLPQPTARYTFTRPEAPQTAKSARPAAQAAPTPPEPIGPDEFAAINARRETLTRSEARLLQQLSRAASQGLVTARLPQVTAPDQPEPTTSQDQPVTRIHLNATTSVDRDQRFDPSAQPVGANDPTCIPNEQLMLSEWSDGQGFAPEIANWRRGLYSEFDKVNPEAALGLARAYLHFGFGAEAVRSTDLMPPEQDDRAVLSALGRIVDGEQDGGVFAGQHGCETDAAFWAIMAAPPGQDLSGRNTVAMLQAYHRLPTHLRAHLGPSLARKLTALNDGENAALVLRAARRTPSHAVSDTALAAAGLATLQGETEEAETHLDAAIIGGGAAAPEALVAKVEARWDTRAALAPEEVAVLASYANEYRRANSGPALRAALSVAYGLSGDFSAAFEALGDVERRDGSAARALPEARLIELLAINGADAEFAERALARLSQDDDGWSWALRQTVAARFLDIGLPMAARDVLSRGEAGRAPDEVTLVIADSYLGTGDPAAALDALRGLDGDRANILRGRAYLLAGNFSSAARLFDVAGDEARHERAMWLAGSWQSSEDDKTEYADHARVFADHARPVPVSNGQLAEAQALLADSEDRRAAIEKLRLDRRAPADP